MFLRIISTEEVKQNMFDVGFEVISVARKPKKRAGTTIVMSLILVQLNNTDLKENIFNLSQMGHLLIKVEYRKNTTYILQC